MKRLIALAAVWLMIALPAIPSDLTLETMRMGAAGHAKMAREFSRAEVVAQTCGALFEEGLA